MCSFHFCTCEFPLCVCVCVEDVHEYFFVDGWARLMSMCVRSSNGQGKRKERIVSLGE